MGKGYRVTPRRPYCLNFFPLVFLLVVGTLGMRRLLSVLSCVVAVVVRGGGGGSGDAEGSGVVISVT